MLNAENVREMLRQECKRAGSQRAWAERNGVSEAYVSNVLSGRREPADAVCNALKLDRVVSYWPRSTPVEAT